MRYNARRVGRGDSVSAGARDGCGEDGVAKGATVREAGRRRDVATLVRAAQAGDRRAFHELYLRTVQMQYFAIVGRVGREAAPDILQELYLVAWSNLDVIDPAAFVGYLNATARNLCKRHFKRQGTSKAPLPTEDEMLEAAGAERAVVAPAAADPAQRADERDEAARLARALREELTDQERDAVLMRYYQDMKLDEIAASLAVSRATVKRILNRALATLRRKMGLLPLAPAFSALLEQAVEVDRAPDGWLRCARVPSRRGREGATKLVGVAAVLLAVGAVLFAAGAPRPEVIFEQPAPLAQPAVADTQGPVLVESDVRDGVTVLRLADESAVVEVYCLAADGQRFEAAPERAVSESAPSAAETLWHLELPTGTYELHARDAVGNQSVGTLTAAVTPDAF